MGFHLTLPLIMVAYTEQPVPWERVLVYNATPSDRDYRLFYNTSYFVRDIGRIEIYKSMNFYLMFLRKKSGNRYIIETGKIFDFMKGRFVGRLHIPAKEKCNCIRDSQKKQHPLQTFDMIFFIFCCILRNPDRISLIYYTIKRYIGNEIVFSLTLMNASPHPRIPAFYAINERIPAFYAIVFARTVDACLLDKYDISHKFLRFVILRNIIGATIRQRCTQPTVYDLMITTGNVPLGIYLGHPSSTKSKLVGFVASCFSRNGLAENDIVRPLHIDIHMTHKHYFHRKPITVDQYSNIREIQLPKGDQGNSSVYYTVNLYAPA
jgi:hypothetical protein